MLIVFDTCTHPQYYGDVHQLLALPPGSVLKYEYKRYLFSEAAADFLAGRSAGDMPLDVALFYGQLREYRKGDGDENLPMLRTSNAIFVPTRSARIVNVAIDPSSKLDDELITFHLELRGYPSPSLPAIGSLMSYLEELNQLPFGDRETQHCWIAMAPRVAGLDFSVFSTGSETAWADTVEALMTRPSQFANDIFWRQSHLRKPAKDNSGPVDLPLVLRPTNRFGSSSDWHSDYEIDDTTQYMIEIRQYAPSAHGGVVSADATLAVVEQGTELLSPPTTPAQIRPNATMPIYFGVKPIYFIGQRFVSMTIRTERSEKSGFPPGSFATITCAVAKSRYRLILAGALAAMSVLSAATVAGAKNLPPWILVLLGISSVISGFFAYYVFRGEIRVGK
jgi:hypothetical protein